MTKNLAARAMQFCADEAVQTLGGAGFIRGTRSERIYREAKVFAIGGGAEEIMKDLAAQTARMVTHGTRRRWKPSCGRCSRRTCRSTACSA